MPGGSEWFLIILAVLVLFGAKKIPEFMRGLGKGIREFNDAKDNVRNEIENGAREKDNIKETVVTHNADGSVTKTVTNADGSVTKTTTTTTVA